MRADMDKVIVERPKANRSWAPKGNYGRKYPVEIEDLPSREGIPNSRLKRKRKYPNENLSPLKRYLEGNVGRPWAKVFSEICERINVNSAVQLHIRQHLFDFVETKTFMKDGKVWVNSPHRGPIALEKHCGWLYVHPIDGLLKAVKFPKRRNEPRPVTRVDGPRGTQFHKINGVWLAVQVKPLPKNLYDPVAKAATAQGNIRDILTGDTLCELAGPRAYGEKLWRTYGKNVYGVALKRMKFEQLQAAGLKNDGA